MIRENGKVYLDMERAIEGTHNSKAGVMSYIRVCRTPTNLYTVYIRIYSNYFLCSEDDVVRSDNAKQNLCRNSLL